MGRLLPRRVSAAAVRAELRRDPTVIGVDAPAGGGGGRGAGGGGSAAGSVAAAAEAADGMEMEPPSSPAMASVWITRPLRARGRRDACAGSDFCRPHVFGVCVSGAARVAGQDDGRGGGGEGTEEWVRRVVGAAHVVAGAPPPASPASRANVRSDAPPAGVSWNPVFGVYLPCVARLARPSGIWESGEGIVRLVFYVLLAASAAVCLAACTRCGAGSAIFLSPAGARWRPARSVLLFSRFGVKQPRTARVAHPSGGHGEGGGKV